MDAWKSHRLLRVFSGGGRDGAVANACSEDRVLFTRAATISHSHAVDPIFLALA